MRISELVLRPERSKTIPARFKGWPLLSRSRWILPLALSLQSVLLFSHLSLLPIWTDELFTFEVVGKAVPEMLQVLQRDIHPPLYFLLLHIWPWNSIEGLRAFSALWALAATALLNCLWVRNWRPERRMIALALFAFSPCLLLYGRMARSYTMQTAFALLAVWLLWRSLRLRRPILGAAVASLALLYTHYVPGIAVIAAFGLAELWLGRPRRATAIFALFVLGYLPWLLTLSDALSRWSSAAGFSSQYKLTGALWSEHLLKLAFGTVSLTIGETLFPASLLIVPMVLYFVGRGVSRSPRTLTLCLCFAGVLGYFGVSRWVSYPFVPARLLWLLPFLVLSLMAGMGARRWPSAILLISSVASIFSYFAGINYLNHGYQAPLREIAAELNRRVSPRDRIIIDGHNTDYGAQVHYLLPQARALVAPGDPQFVRSELAKARRVWFVRNLRDISPRLATSALQNEFCASRARQEWRFLPYDPWQFWLLKEAHGRPSDALLRCDALRPAARMTQDQLRNFVPRSYVMTLAVLARENTVEHTEERWIPRCVKPSSRPRVWARGFFPPRRHSPRRCCLWSTSPSSSTA